MNLVYYGLVAFQITLVVIGFIILWSMFYIIRSFKNPLPFVPTNNKTARKMVELADLKPGERAVDLGSGSGRLIIQLGRRYRSNEIVGYEYKALLRFVTNLKKSILRLKNVKVENRDLFTADLSEFNVVAVFLTGDAHQKLISNYQQLPVGARIVSYLFRIENLHGFKEELVNVTKYHKVYRYSKI